MADEALRVSSVGGWRMAGAPPKWTMAGVIIPMPEWRCSSLYQGKKC